MKKLVICLTFLLLFVGFINAQTKSMTGTVVDVILENKWSAIVIEVGGKRYGVQTGYWASAGDTLDGSQPPRSPKIIGKIDRIGQRVQVFYTKIDKNFDFDGINTWLTAVKIVEIKKSKRKKK